jgi:hypothetical protein
MCAARSRALQGAQPGGAGPQSVEGQPRWTPRACVRGAPKMYTHLMFDILVIAAEQRLRLLN